MARDDPNLLEQLLGRLDALVVFMALDRHEFFDRLVEHEFDWLQSPGRAAVHRGLAVYQQHVRHGAFLLGYSYFEAFLSDLATVTYRAFPMKLSKDRQYKAGDLLDLTPSDSVVDLLIEREVRSVFGGSIASILDHFDRKLDLRCGAPERDALVRASFTRNCLLHNDARVDRLLAEASGLRVGSELVLTPSEVHSAGLAGRKLATQLWHCASHLHAPPTPRPLSTQRRPRTKKVRPLKRARRKPTVDT